MQTYFPQNYSRRPPTTNHNLLAHKSKLFVCQISFPYFSLLILMQLILRTFCKKKDQTLDGRWKNLKLHEAPLQIPPFCRSMFVKFKKRGYPHLKVGADLEALFCRNSSFFCWRRLPITSCSYHQHHHNQPIILTLSSLKF